jgi:hypothetical protein
MAALPNARFSRRNISTMIYSRDLQRLVNFVLTNRAEAHSKREGVMRSIVLNGAGGLVLAASLAAGLPVVAEERNGSAASSTVASEAAVAEGTAASPVWMTVVGPRDLKDLALANNPRRSEFADAVVANPKNPNMLLASVATCGASACRSVVYRSHDAGRTWSQPIALPCTSDCGGVALAYAPDGKRVYAAYSDGGILNWSIVASSSEDNGATWLPPVLVLKAAEDGLFYYRSVRITTPLDESESRWIYMTAVEKYQSPGGWFIFTRSADFGATWSKPQGLGWWGSSSEYGLQGGAVAGGKAGEVLVAGPGVDEFYRWGAWVKRSQNHGGKFVTVVAATENPESVDVKIGYKGAAHVVYQRYVDRPYDYGDIAYIWSPGPPYTTWSKPVTVNDDGAGRSQYNPSLTAQKCGASTVLHLVWEDARLRPMADCYNQGSSFDCYWDVLYARKIAKPGAVWSKNVRVSGKPSLTGDYVSPSPDVAASQGRVVTVWTDRRDNTDVDDYETDVYASGILSGVTCP